MKALLAGETRASLGVVAGLVGVLMLLATSFALTMAYRAQIQDFKDTVYTRCLERTRIDLANNESVKADAELYQQLLDIADKAPRQANPTLAALVVEQRRVIEQARDRKEKAAQAGVIGDCAVYART